MLLACCIHLRAGAMCLTVLSLLTPGVCYCCASDAALDFLSPHFDPLRALYEQALEPLVPVSARDNVAACGCLLHERDPLYRADNTEKKAERVNKRKQTAADEQHKRAMKMEMEAAKKSKQSVQATVRHVGAGVLNLTECVGVPLLVAVPVLLLSCHREHEFAVTLFRRLCRTGRSVSC